jgi:hypothetical protein
LVVLNQQAFGTAPSLTEAGSRGQLAGGVAHDFNNLLSGDPIRMLRLSTLLGSLASRAFRNLQIQADTLSVNQNDTRVDQLLSNALIPFVAAARARYNTKVGIWIVNRT